MHYASLKGFALKFKAKYLYLLPYYTGCSKVTKHIEKCNIYFYYAYFLKQVLKMPTITLFTKMHTTNRVSEHVLQCASLYPVHSALNVGLKLLQCVWMI